MKSRINSLIWTVVICSFLLIFLPAQIASQLLSQILIIIIGVVSLIAQFMASRIDESSTKNRLQYIALAVLTIATMVLMYFM
ncbi:hypothetical protein SAMN06298216_4459 [Spirosomataceae bacterium TFI 002]|nr:hypothetical protein SAMN06298216_4459 [Spirosomataceae bacterium TFI 002]